MKEFQIPLLANYYSALRLYKAISESKTVGGVYVGAVLLKRVLIHLAVHPTGLRPGSKLREDLMLG